MIPLSVSEIHCKRGFCDEQDEDEQEEELGILVVGFHNGAPVSPLVQMFNSFNSGTIQYTL